MKILCYGDSNTYGYDPRSFLGDRYPADSRWVDLLAKETGWEVINRGMNGREIPVKGIPFPDNLDLLIVMLGSNDLLQGADAGAAAARMEAFLRRLTLSRDKILLIAPPPMQPGQWVNSSRLIDASRKLGDEYSAVAQRLGVRFADAAKWDIELCFDGVHFTEKGHRAFSEALAQTIKNVR